MAVARKSAIQMFTRTSSSLLSRCSLGSLAAPARVFSSEASKYEFKDLYDNNFLGLPRLPIPPLSHTLERYVESAKPLCTSEEQTKHLVKQAKEFEKGEGARLNEALKKLDDHKGYPYSYIEKHWDDMYLGLRCCNPVYVSPFFKIVDLPGTQTERAAAFVHSFAKWTRKVLDGKLEADVVGKEATPLCSSAFSLMFSSAKIPKKDRDEIVQYKDSRTVTVVSEGNVYAIEVISEDGKLLDVAGITKQLDTIKEMSTPAEIAIPMLTAEDRDVWAGVRAKMEEDPANKASLQLADQGLLAVALDPNSFEDLSALGQSILCGPGEHRWADKQQLLAYADGKMAMNFEHSYSDGMGWGRFIHDVMCDTTGSTKYFPGAGPLPSMPIHSDAPPPKKLDFVITPEVKAAVDTAASTYKALQDDVQTYHLDFNHFGKKEMKKWKTSPDAAMQLAYQVAYYNLHSRMPGVYEACATRRFFHGRTETIRSLTPDSHRLAEAMATVTDEALNAMEEDDAEDIMDLLQLAAKTHSKVSKDSSNGMGCDRHLLAMQKIVLSEGSDMPEFYTNPLYEASKTSDLSTSNGTSTPYIDQFGFGAVAYHGYGLGYLITDNRVSVNITTFAGSDSLSSKTMGDEIEKTLLKFKKLAEIAD
ncbi:hypothetical protein CYMTET_36882 [Cymbomonas tetramitiformis]|uniref:Choline/carnitine acyltransferase domain-containing protein n=1 Tax=Cymbomonas tetramitiformis TaxID=36881 RepID=A0AAE0F6T5_9CHLO|nr:hypothetical protein CYMTET_36882 [Cymbomonas tetramitiformis]